MTSPEPSELSERELEILRLVATGAGNKEIAQKLYISTNTVKVHIRNIFTKIGASSRTEAAMYAVRTGLVTNPVNQVVEDDNEDNISLKIGLQTETKPASIGDELVLPANRKLPRYISLLFLVGFIILLFLGWRLSPGFAIFSTSTATSLPPRNTPTAFPHWNELAALPIARGNLAVVAFGNQIYVIGGLGIQGVYGGMDRFDPVTNTWVSLSSKPTPVFDARAAVISGLIFVPGGRTNTANPKPTNIMEIYDTSTDQWKTGTPLPIPLSGYGLVAYEGMLYVFGGWDGEKFLNNVYAYNPTTDTWKERTSMPTPRAFSGVAESGGKIYVIGGIYENQPVTANEIYTPSHDHNDLGPWETGFPLPENRMGSQASNIADTIYVFGGDPEQSNRVGLIYFPQTNIWQSLETSPYPLGDDFGMTAIGTNLFFIGGLFDSTFTDQNLTYQAILTLSIPIIIK
jgi:DNA-binding CsgD family transcriptional regulator/N-acetylneuraminic acid mutarotase